MLRACMEVNREESGEIEGDCRVTLILWLKNLSVDEICAFQRKWLGGCLFAVCGRRMFRRCPLLCKVFGLGSTRISHDALTLCEVVTSLHRDFFPNGSTGIWLWLHSHAPALLQRPLAGLLLSCFNHFEVSITRQLLLVQSSSSILTCICAERPDRSSHRPTKPCLSPWSCRRPIIRVAFATSSTV